MLYTKFMELLCETQPKSEGLLWKGNQAEWTLIDGSVFSLTERTITKMALDPSNNTPKIILVLSFCEPRW